MFYTIALCQRAPIISEIKRHGQGVICVNFGRSFCWTGCFYWTSSAGRGHPPAWLSSHKLGRAVALADAMRRISAILPAGTKPTRSGGKADRPPRLMARSQAGGCPRPAPEVKQKNPVNRVNFAPIAKTGAARHDAEKRNQERASPC